MTTLSPLSTVTNTNQATGQTTRKTTLTQEDFMNLLVTQLQNQNPLEPMDINQMGSQIAQFSSLQALNDISKSLETISSSQATMNNLQASMLIGKKVETNVNSLTINQGKVSENYYQLAKPGKVMIQIYDGGGSLIRAIEKGITDTSKQKLDWDGKSQNGVQLPDGNYSYQISAVDGNGQSIPVNSSAIKTITGVTFTNGVIYLNSDSGEISLSDIKSIVN